MLRSGSSLAMALALAILCACAPSDPCDVVYCGPGRCDASSGQAVCDCPQGYVQADMSCKRNVRKGDDHGDSIEAATPLEFMDADQSMHANLDIVDDVDLFSFRIKTGRIYRFSCRRYLDEGYEGYEPTCLVELLGADGLKLPGSVGSGGPAYYQAAVLATQDGTVYARVKGFSASPSTFDTRYEYSLVDRGPDDFGNTLAEATRRPVGTNVSGHIEPYGDVDVVALDVVAGRTYRLVCGGVGNNNCGMRVRDPGGEVLYQAAMVETKPKNDTFDLQVMQEGRHTVELFFTTGLLFSYGVGDYTFSATDLEP
ncbi:hypothetical protein HRD49_24245 [Corallococcus exiguus]|uniref:hypothetical protein n=1 Tax=Corallococcus TaxID=83461 RepID=UPI000F888E9B|nr:MULTISPECIES: hypothetical protein [Corallococcus]NNC16066.1 hypothetical protein [Corallococcus exiguus]NRD53007.1 hypothetical protein [Corallococcus exiguus]NRD64868.1 hypothetical protein [Corallococcus exiguus]RUO90671.1 hypothetical protein D7Y11_23835 [Corallococcus sp. AB018]